MEETWESFIESKDENGKSNWKERLSNLNDYKSLMELYKYLDDELQSDVNKFFVKGTKAAARRARIYAQKIKDVMGQLRNVIQSNK